MDIDLLSAFECLTRDLDIKTAATRLKVGETVITTRLAALEAQLGTKLFHRGGVLSLTDQGLAFLPFARRLLNADEQARQAMLHKRRSIAIGCLGSLVAPLITDAVVNFQTRHPDVDITLHEGRHSQLAGLLHEQRIELGVIAWPNLDPLVRGVVPLLVMREKVPLVMAPALATRLPVNPTLADIVAIQPRALSVQWWQVMPKAYTQLVERAETHLQLPFGPARSLAVRGDGVGYLTASSIFDDLEAGRLVEVVPSDAEPLYRDTALVALSDMAASCPIVIDFAREIAARYMRIGAVIENRFEAPLVAAE